MQAWFGDLVDRLVALEPQAWLVLVVVVLLLVGFGYLGNWIVGSMLRAGLSAEFGLTDVPHGIRIRLGYRVPEGEMTLSFPRWLYPNRDGTRDRRRSRNALIGLSTLALGRYRVRSRNPFRVYELCRQARGPATASPGRWKNRTRAGVPSAANGCSATSGARRRSPPDSPAIPPASSTTAPDFSVVQGTWPK